MIEPRIERESPRLTPGCITPPAERKPSVSDVLPEGNMLIEAWIHSDTAVRRAEEALKQAVANRVKVTAQLAKWMLPGDAKDGEKIAIWYQDYLVQVEVGEPCMVTIRQRGRATNRII